VLSYALFPDVALAFFAANRKPQLVDTAAE
jgi:hypothetical protein